MSAAIRATTAQERATIAAAYIRRNPGQISRGFSDCFEMGDGEEVLRLLRIMAKRSPVLRANWSRFLSASLEG